jgi:hypothetical protein
MGGNCTSSDQQQATEGADSLDGAVHMLITVAKQLLASAREPDSTLPATADQTSERRAFDAALALVPAIGDLSETVRLLTKFALRPGGPLVPTRPSEGRHSPAAGPTRERVVVTEDDLAALIETAGQWASADDPRDPSMSVGQLIVVSIVWVAAREFKAKMVNVLGPSRVFMDIGARRHAVYLLATETSLGADPSVGLAQLARLFGKGEHTIVDYVRDTGRKATASTLRAELYGLARRARELAGIRDQ